MLAAIVVVVRAEHGRRHRGRTAQRARRRRRGADRAHRAGTGRVLADPRRARRRRRPRRAHRAVRRALRARAGARRARCWRRGPTGSPASSTASSPTVCSLRSNSPTRVNKRGGQRGSLGRPRTRSPTMLRWIWLVPPQIVSAREEEGGHHRAHRVALAAGVAARRRPRPAVGPASTSIESGPNMSSASSIASWCISDQNILFVAPSAATPGRGSRSASPTAIAAR